MTDFETAVYFPPDVPLDKRTYVGRPAGSSFPADPKEYNRPSPPEVLTGEPYNPFKLDVWQFATSLSDFKVSQCALTFPLSLKRMLQSTVPAIDDILDAMRNPDPASRLASHEALKALGSVVASMPPASLHIAPVCL